MADDEGQKKGPTELEKQVEAGLAAMTTEVKLELDTAGAEAYKAEAEAKIDAMKAEEAALTGKDNKKARTEKGKAISAAKAEPKYVDALKVLKGLDPPNGNFILSKSGGEKPKAAEAPAAEPEKPKEKKEEKPKKEAKPGKITKEELAELDKLKNDIIARKTQLKADGLSGGQQNKDEQIVAWVTRMNELKEKQDPGSTQKKPDESKKKKGKLSPDDQLALDALKKEIEEYKQKCISEFGMTKKDLKTDPDLMEMEAKAADMEKRAK